MKENVPSAQAVRPEQGLRAAVLSASVRPSEAQRPTETTARAVSMIKKAVPAGKERVSGRNVPSAQVVRPEQGLRVAVLPASVRHSERMEGVLRNRKVRRGLSGKTPGRDSRLKKVRRFRRTGAVRPENRD